jgi:hypothetical protein
MPQLDIMNWFSVIVILLCLSFIVLVSFIKFVYYSWSKIEILLKLSLSQTLRSLSTTNFIQKKFVTDLNSFYKNKKKIFTITNLETTTYLQQVESLWSNVLKIASMNK